MQEKRCGNHTNILEPAFVQVFDQPLGNFFPIFVIIQVRRTAIANDFAEIISKRAILALHFHECLRIVDDCAYAIFRAQVARRLRDARNVITGKLSHLGGRETGKVVIQVLDVIHRDEHISYEASRQTCEQLIVRIITGKEACGMLLQHTIHPVLFLPSASLFLFLEESSQHLRPLYEGTFGNFINFALRIKGNDVKANEVDNHAKANRGKIRVLKCESLCGARVGKPIHDIPVLPTHTVEHVYSKKGEPLLYDAPCVKQNPNETRREEDRTAYVTTIDKQRDKLREAACNAEEGWHIYGQKQECSLVPYAQGASQPIRQGEDRASDIMVKEIHIDAKRHNDTECANGKDPGRLGIGRKLSLGLKNLHFADHIKDDARHYKEGNSRQPNGQPDMGNVQERCQHDGCKIGSHQLEDNLAQ